MPCRVPASRKPSGSYRRNRDGATAVMGDEFNLRVSVEEMAVNKTRHGRGCWIDELESARTMAVAGSGLSGAGCAFSDPGGASKKG